MEGNILPALIIITLLPSAIVYLILYLVFLRETRQYKYLKFILIPISIVITWLVIALYYYLTGKGIFE